MTSIRLFLIAVLFSTLAIVMFVAMLIGYQRSLQQAEIMFEMELQEKHELISGFLHHLQVQPSSTLVLQSENRIDQHKPTLFQVLDQHNRVVLQSAELGNKPLVTSEDGVTDFNFDGRRWHAMIKAADGLPYRILVAEQDDVRFRLADALIVDILQPIVMGLFCIVLLIWFIVQAGFKPVTKLTEAIREKSASDLSAIPIDHIPKELQAISASVNELFLRLTNAFEREKRFTADAAHEMRNPITALKIHIDNLLEEVPEKNESLVKIKQAIDRLSKLVDQMLVLHRMSPDQYLANFSCISLNAVVQDVIAELYPEIEKKSQTIELEGSSGNIQADLFGIEVLVKNLITNASKYTPAQGIIRVRLLDNAPGSGDVTLVVEDSGVGIPEPERQRVFDRFYRVGGDRHNSHTVGSGLGLSIVRHIAELHQARWQLKTSSLGGLCVEICFPAQRRCNTGESHS